MGHAVVTWDTHRGEWEINYLTRLVWINCGSCGNTWKPRRGEALTEVMPS